MPKPTSTDELDSAILAGIRVVVPGYRLVDILGRGGQATVYKAINLCDGEPVAIKVLHGGPLANADARARFEREIIALKALNHPNIVTHRASGQTPAGHDYLVMNYIAGQRLDEFLWKSNAGVPMDLERRLRLFIKICSAVGEAHRAGITHRDLSPSNIPVDGAGEPHILDFGLARTPLDDLLRGENGPMTATHQFVGKLAYASPEQIGTEAGPIDIRTDVYSLGVMLYQLLAGGKFPYDVHGSIAEVLDNIVKKIPEPPVSASGRTGHFGLQKKAGLVALRALNKRRGDRQESANELASELKQCLSGHGIPSTHRWGLHVRLAAGVLLTFTLTLLFLGPGRVLRLIPTTAASAARAGRFFPAQMYHSNGWKIQQDELVQTLTSGHQTLLFGDPHWSKYDFTFKVMVNENVNDGFCAVFHWTGDDNYGRFRIGSYQGRATELGYFTNGQWHRLHENSRGFPFIYHHWYEVRLEVRDTEVHCFLDGVQLFAGNNEGYRIGCPGFETYGCGCHIRDIRITAPDGTLLLSGFPDVAALPAKDPGVSHPIVADTQLSPVLVAPRPTMLAADFPLTGDEARKVQREYAAATGLPMTTSLRIDATRFIKFALIPPGHFLTGALEEYASPDEQRPHRITISHAYYLATTPVTVAQYSAFARQTHFFTSAIQTGTGFIMVQDAWKASPNASWHNPGFEISPDYPVVEMTWSDAVEFCKWISKLTGYTVRLPTSAEWEYACRAGTSTRFYTGDTMAELEKAGWCLRNSLWQTHPVGQKTPNAWGLYDMHGNASQWCQDWFAGPPIADAVDPTGPEVGELRVKRGGSWAENYLGARSGWIGSNHPNTPDSSEGFRILLELPELFPSTRPSTSER